MSDCSSNKRMADSDEEYDRRRVRDKFRRERSDYQERNAGSRREDWPDSRDGGNFWGNGPSSKDRVPNRGGNRDYGRDYGGNQRRDRYGGSPGDRSDMSPPMKRVRGRDWDDRNYDNYGSHSGSNWSGNDNAQQSGHSSNYGSGGNQSGHSSNSPTQPAMMTFKQFLATLDDSIDDMESVKKYNEYKIGFRRQQIHDFFLAHKDEEWFRSRYHPDECGKRKDEQAASLKNRLKVFLDLLDTGFIDSVSIDVEKSEQITRVLDAAVIKLEGGTDFDLKALDENFDDDKPKEPDLSLFTVDEKPVEKKSEDFPSPVSATKRKSVEAEETSEDGEVRKAAESVSQSEKEEESVDGKEDTEREEGEESQDAKSEPAEDEVKKEATESTASAVEPIQEPEPESAKSPVEEEQDAKEEARLKPRPLHKTASIFLRNLAPSITKQEVEAMCKQHAGFLRVAIADPQPERRFYRRGWVTFEKSVNIREICWNMNNVRLRDCELGAIVNRDLSRRIRSVNGIASHKNVIRADIRHAAKIVFNLDQQKKLWEETGEVKAEEAPSESTTPVFGFPSKNPLLKNITDYLIEEASAEEEELLGAEAGELENEDSSGGQTLERDENLIRVLDRLLLYLRIVHSVDYYNCSDYPNEDEMPNRIGIMHARGSPPSSKITTQEINEYIKNFEAKIQPFLQPPQIITEEEAVKLGKKDQDEEVEKFIKDNTQELAKDKWLCPLSGKKFKGPNFVRKHILNKHGERLEEVKKDVEYFNSYLMDPKRPQLPEHPSNRPQTNQGNQRDGHNMNQNNQSMGAAGSVPWPIPHAPYPGPPPYMQPYPPRGGIPLGFAGGMMGAWNAPGGRSYPPMGPPMDYPRAGGVAARGRYGRRDPRDLVGYHELDGDPVMI